MAPPVTEDDIRRTYRETIDDLYAFVSRRCDGDRDLAEDVTQETWLRAVRAWRDDGFPDRPFAWLSTVAARILSSHFRRNNAISADKDMIDALPANDASASEEAEDRRSLVQRALARLSVPQTRFIKAFHYERRTVADIASSTGLSERAVEGRLRRARQQLRRQIEADLAADGNDS